MSVRGVLGSVVLAVAATTGASGCGRDLTNADVAFLVNADKNADGRLSHMESMNALYRKFRPPLRDGELNSAVQSAERARAYVPQLADDFIAAAKILGYKESE